MSRLESNANPNPIFKIHNDEELTSGRLNAVPLKMRKEAMEQFDREFRIEERARVAAKTPLNSENHLSKPNATEIAECIFNANRLFEEKEFQVARELYRAVLKLEPGQEVAIRGLASCAKAISDHEEAVNVLKRLVLTHSSSENYKILGDQLYFMEYNEDAVDAYLRALSFSTIGSEEQFHILKNCGNILLRMGDPNAAEEYYNKAYTISPDSDVLLVNFGSLALYRGKYETALARFREAVSINDKNDKAWVGLGMIHREYGDSELAWANVEKALDIKPGNESAIKLVSDWAMKDNEIERAVYRLEAYLKLSSNDSIILLWLAKFYYFSGRLALANSTAEKSLRLDPNIEGGLEVLTVIKSEIQQRELKSK